MSEMMQVVEITTPGAAEVLALGTRPRPEPRQGELRIKIMAAGLNGADLAQRRGVYPPPEGITDVPGLEVSGVVDALGEGVTGFALGDRVCALLAGGGYAQYCTVPAGHVLPLPDAISFTDGAGLIEAIATVQYNVFGLANLRPGETILIHGGTSGIGVTAIQMAKAYGCEIITTVGSAEKARVALELGAKRAILYREEDFAEVMRAEKLRADVILDIVGGPYLDQNTRSMRYGGRMVTIAFGRGRHGELDFARVMMNRLTLMGSTLRSRSIAEKDALIAAVREQVWPLLTQGKFRPVTDSTFSFADAAAAHLHMESSKHIGKIILEGGL